MNKGCHIEEIDKCIQIMYFESMDRQEIGRTLWFFQQESDEIL